MATCCSCTFAHTTARGGRTHHSERVNPIAPTFASVLGWLFHLFRASIYIVGRSWRELLVVQAGFGIIREWVRSTLFSA